jgi:thiol:disulfide interchange protein DsbA
MFKQAQVVAMSVLFLLALGCTAAPQSNYEEGKHYQKVDNPKPDKAKATVSVEEFFSFGCPHCFHLEEKVHSWEKTKPDYIKFSKTPAFWNEYFEMLARAFYIAEVNGMADKVSGAIFSGIHEQKRVRTESDVIAVFEENGLTADKFNSDFTSFAVEQKMKLAGKRFRDYGLRSVPVFVVGGMYSTDVGKAGGPKELFEVIEFLAEKVKSERK